MRASQEVARRREWREITRRLADSHAHNNFGNGDSLTFCVGTMSKKVDTSFMKLVATDAEWSREVSDAGGKVLCGT